MCQKYLTSDKATFMVEAKKSRHNKVWFGEPLSRLTEWKVLPYDPQFRLELEYTPVPVSILNY